MSAQKTGEPDDENSICPACAGGFSQFPMLTTLCGGIQDPQLLMEWFPARQVVARIGEKRPRYGLHFLKSIEHHGQTSRWSIAMNTSDFEANLVADGYTEIETQSLAPRPGKGHHGHHFAIRGLVLAGTFTVTQDNRRVTYGPGEIFAVAQDHPHDEEVGPEGARVLVGRKYGTA